MRYFQTLFLEEADKFINGLDPKVAGKVIYNIDLAEQNNDPKLLRNFKKIFGNSEQILADNKSGCWLFGIKKMKYNIGAGNARLYKKS